MLGSALRKGLTFVPAAGERSSLLTRWRPGVSTAAGLKVGPTNATRAAAVYSAITLTADTLAALPIRFMDELRAVDTASTRVLTGQKANAFQTPVDYIQTIVMSQLLHGEALVYPRYTRGGDAGELWPIDPERVVDVERLDGENGQIGLRFRIEDWHEHDGWAENRPGQPVQLMHIPLHVLPGRIRGMSPITEAAELIGMSLSSQEHAARFLGDGVHMTGTIETAADLEPEEAKELWDNFQLAHAGPSKAGRVGVLTGGATFKTMVIPPSELQFLEQMKLTDQRIHAMYRVPPHLMGDVERSTSWGAGIEEQTNNWVKFRLINLARKIEAAHEPVLMPGTTFNMRLVMNGLLRGVARDRAEFYRVLWNMGVLTQDDILGFEDLPPVPDGKGQQRYIPLNVAPLGESPDTLQQRARAWLALAAEGR